MERTDRVILNMQYRVVGCRLTNSLTDLNKSFWCTGQTMNMNNGWKSVCSMVLFGVVCGSAVDAFKIQIGAFQNLFLAARARQERVGYALKLKLCVRRHILCGPFLCHRRTWIMHTEMEFEWSKLFGRRAGPKRSRSQGWVNDDCQLILNYCWKIRFRDFIFCSSTTVFANRNILPGGERTN